MNVFGELDQSRPRHSTGNVKPYLLLEPSRKRHQQTWGKTVVTLEIA